jgi:hypothetical protein
LTAGLSIPEPILAALEVEQTKIPSPYALIYDSDDEETRTTLKHLPRPWVPRGHVMEMCLCSLADLSGAADADTEGIHGWIPEFSRLEEFRKLEEGG